MTEPTLSTYSSNSPSVNESYVPYGNLKASQADFDKVATAMNSYCILPPGQSRFSVMTTARFATDFLKDRINPLITSQLESDVINATCYDRAAPERKYLERLIAYTMHRVSSSEEDRTAEVLRLLIKRVTHSSLIVVTKVVIVLHLMIAYADTRVSEPNYE
eukprot:PhF_6_TR35855/c1_g1_i1/m.52052